MKYWHKFFILFFFLFGSMFVVFAQEEESSGESFLEEMAPQRKRESNFKNANALLLEKVENLWKWGGKLKKDFPGLLEGKYEKQTVEAMIEKHSEKVQIMDSLFDNMDTTKIYDKLQSFGKELGNSRQYSKTYGLPKEVWKECSFEYQGIWILDMTTLFWENLPADRQREYARVYQRGYADFLGKQVEENFFKDNITIPFISQINYLTL